MNGARNGTFFLAPPPGAVGRGQKVKDHKISITKSISKKIKPNFVCLLTNERYKTFQTGFSLGHLDHAPGVMLGGQNLNFLNMVMLHIILKGMISRPGYNENFYLRIKLVTLGWGQKVKYQ